MCLPVPATGLDLVDFVPVFSQFQATSDTDIARRAFLIRHLVQPMQESFTAIQKVQQLAGTGYSLHSIAYFFCSVLSQ